MTTKEWWSEFRVKIKIFLWYLATEPFRQLMQILKNLIQMFEALNKTLTWAYVALVIVIISLFTGERKITASFLFVFLLGILSWEWQRGFFMHRYRQKIKKKIKKEILEKESPSVYGEIKTNKEE